MRKIILIVILIAVSLRSLAFRNDSLPATDSLFAALRAYHEAKAYALTTEQNTAETVKWMRWIPSFGIGYNLQGQPRPTVNFSIDRIYTNVKERNVRTAKIAAIQQQSSIEFKTDSLLLLVALQRLNIAKSASDELQAAQSIDNELFSYSQQNYDEKKISTYQFLTEKRQYFERKERIAAKSEQVRIFEIEVLRACKW